MNVKINTKEKKITILEECSFKELESFLKNLEDYKDYTVVSEIQYNWWCSPTTITTNGNGFQYYNTNPYSGTITTKSADNSTFTSNM